MPKREGYQEELYGYSSSSGEMPKHYQILIQKPENAAPNPDSMTNGACRQNATRLYVDKDRIGMMIVVRNFKQNKHRYADVFCLR